MAADLIAKLKLDSSNWDTQINKSKKSIKKFETDSKQSMVSLDSVTSKLGGTFTKFAGFIGLAVTAGETLNKMMESNQTTSDLFHNNLNAAKDSVDVFFRSLTTGDWSAFNDGLINTFKNLKELSALMDEIADKKLSLSYIKSEDLKEIEQYETIAKDTNRSLDERKLAAEKMAMAVKHLSQETSEYIQSTEKGLSQTYKANYGIDVDKETLDYFFKHTNKSDKSVLDEIERYKKERIDLEKKYTTDISIPTSYGTINKSVLSNEGKEALKQYDKQNEFIRTQSILLNEVDEKRINTLNTLKEQFDLEREIYSLQKRADETNRGVSTASSSKKPSSTTSKKEEGQQGSLAYLNKEIADLNTKLSLATDEATRYGIRQAIKKLNHEKLMIELEATLGTNTLKTKELKKVQGKIPKDALEVKLTPIANKNLQSKTQLFDTDTSALDYLTAMGSLMGSFTGLADNAGAAWLQYTANLISSVAAMLPALASLFGITAALGIAEQAKIPWPMSLVAMAATGAGLVAAIASIPKFAQGGVVGGNSFVGDKNLVGINSGEMILNKGQQSRLFNLLDGKQSLNNNVNGNVTFKVQGKELIGVLNNYSNKINKY